MGIRKSKSVMFVFGLFLFIPLYVSFDSSECYLFHFQLSSSVS